MLARKNLKLLWRWPFLLSAVLLCATFGWAQQPATTRVWALYLKGQKDSEKKPVARKHFYAFYSPAGAKLTKDAFFKGLLAAVGRPPLLADYQADLVKSGLSEAKAKEFIDNWVLKYRCETVYCQDITTDDLAKISLFKEAHDTNAPLFVKASDSSARAFRWLPNFLSSPVRTGYFDLRRKWTRCATQYIAAPADKGGLGMTVLQGMTNEQGTTIFPSLPAATFYISNLVPLEIGADSSKTTIDLWFVTQEIKPTTVSGRVEMLGRAKDRVEAKDLKSDAAPTFRCEP